MKCPNCGADLIRDLSAYPMIVRFCIRCGYMEVNGKVVSKGVKIVRCPKCNNILRAVFPYRNPAHGIDFYVCDNCNIAYDPKTLKPLKAKSIDYSYGGKRE